MEPINWKRLGAIGELQVLSRASWLLLFIVPILAAIWPAVENTVRQFEKFDVDDWNQNAQEAIQKRIGKRTSDSIGKKTTAVKIPLQQAANEGKRSDDHKSKRVYMAAAWARAFFAAFFLLIAQLVYQSLVPDEVRKRDSSDIQQQWLSELDEKSTESRKRLQRRAQNALAAVGKPTDPPFVNRREEREKIRPVVGPTEVITNMAEIQSDVKLKKKRNELNEDVEYVRQGAAAYYLGLTLKNPRSRLFCAVFYTIALVLIFWTIAEQSIRVAQAAGLIKS